MYLIMFLIFEIFLNVSTEIYVNECGGVFTVPKEINDGCARAMANNSFVAENYGSDFKEKFDQYSNNYYPNELNNSENIIRSMDRFGDPDMSPQTRSIKNSECLISIGMEDRKVAMNHLGERVEGMSSQLKDGILFQMDNTEVSRNDYIFSNRRNS